MAFNMGTERRDDSRVRRGSGKNSTFEKDLSRPVRFPWMGLELEVR